MAQIPAVSRVVKRQLIHKRGRPEPEDPRELLIYCRCRMGTVIFLTVLGSGTALASTPPA
jgi:hypothetical protein